MSGSPSQAAPASAQRGDLLKLLEVARRLATTSDLDQLLALILDQARDVLDAERASIFLYDPDRDELFSRLATGVESIRFPAGAGIAGATARGRATINVPDAYADARFHSDVDRRTGFRTRNILSCPLIDHRDELVGVLQVLNRRHRPFDAYDQALAEMLAAQAAVALQRARLMEQVLETERLKRELAIARQIQQALLPKADPQVGGFEVGGWNQPADQTGGDCFDFFPLADGSLAIAVADATGHGIGPALVVAEARALFRAVARGAEDVAATMAAVNRILAADLPDDRFVTAFFGALDGATGRLSWASGGHGPMLWHRAADDAIVELAATGPPMGIDADLPIDAAEPVALAPGDQFLVITDGFFEFARGDAEQFGIERVGQWLRDSRALPPRQAIAELRARVLAFAAGSPQADDLTAVLIRRRQKSEVRRQKLEDGRGAQP